MSYSYVENASGWETVYLPTLTTTLEAAVGDIMEIEVVGYLFDMSAYAAAYYAAYGGDIYNYYSGNVIGMLLELPYYDFPDTSFGACIANYCGGRWVYGYDNDYISFYAASYDANNPTVPATYSSSYQTGNGLKFVMYEDYMYYLLPVANSWTNPQDIDVVAFSSASADGTNTVTTTTFHFNPAGESAPLMAATALGCGLLVATLM